MTLYGFIFESFFYFSCPALLSIYFYKPTLLNPKQGYYFASMGIEPGIFKLPASPAIYQKIATMGFLKYYRV